MSDEPVIVNRDGLLICDCNKHQEPYWNYGNKMRNCQSVQFLAFVDEHDPATGVVLQCIRCGCDDERFCK